MLELGGILGSLLENLWTLSPIRLQVVREDEVGVRFNRGRLVGTAGPGMHWYLGWGIEELEVVNIAEQVIETDIQTVGDTTANVVIRLKIMDVPKFLLIVEDGYDSVAEIAEGFLGEALAAGHKSVVGQLEEDLQEPCNEWGIKIISVHLQNYCTATPHRILK
jgi:regulator of protease activity HflC (stomatin/prohibitin superfamily)